MAGVTPNSVLAQNLDRLLALKGLGRKEAAEVIGVPYKWLRRAVSQGLGRPDQRNAAHLQRVTTFFGLRRIDDLWRPSLVELGLTARRGFTPCFFFRVPSTVPPSSKPLGHASPIHQQARTSQSAVRLPRHLPV